MDDQEKQNFSRFLQILTDTGNITHATTESGWADHPHNTDGPELDTTDLTNIPPHDLHHHTGASVTLPPAIQAYIQGADSPLTAQERHSITIALEKHYSLPPEFCIIDHPEGDFSLEHNHE